MDNSYYKTMCVAARALLRDHIGRSASIDNLPDVIRLLELKYVSIRSAMTDQTPVQGGGNMREEALNANIEKRERCARALEEAQIATRIVNRALDTLTERERHILEVKYISHQRNATQRLMQEYRFADESSVHRICARALDHFVLAAFNATRVDSLREFLDAVNAYKEFAGSEN